MSAHSFPGDTYFVPVEQSIDNYTVHIDGDDSSITFRDISLLDETFSIYPNADIDHIDLIFASGTTPIMIINGDLNSTGVPLSFPNATTTPITNPSFVVVANEDGGLGFSNISNFQLSSDPTFDSISIRGEYGVIPITALWSLVTADDNTHLDLEFQYNGSTVLELHDPSENNQILITIPSLPSSTALDIGFVTHDSIGNLGSLALSDNQIVTSNAGQLVTVSGTDGIVIDAPNGIIRTGGSGNFSSLIATEISGNISRYDTTRTASFEMYDNGSSDPYTELIFDEPSVNLIKRVSTSPVTAGGFDRLFELFPLPNSSYVVEFTALSRFTITNTPTGVDTIYPIAIRRAYLVNVTTTSPLEITSTRLLLPGTGIPYGFEESPNPISTGFSLTDPVVINNVRQGRQSIAITVAISGASEMPLTVEVQILRV